MLVNLLISTAAQTYSLFSATLNTLQRPTSLFSCEQIMTFVIAGCSLGIIAYHVIFYRLTRQPIYLHFAGALLCFSIAIGMWNSIWPTPPWPRDCAMVVLDTLSLILFISFSQQFLELFVSFKRSHPVITQVMNGYMMLGGVLIISQLVFAHPVLYLIKSTLIIVASLTMFATLPNWYPTIKHLRTFIATMTLFALINVYTHMCLMLNAEHFISLTHQNIYYFSCLLIFLSFSSLITSRLNQDRKQRNMAQQAAVQALEVYQDIYKNSLEGLFTTRLDGHLLSANPALLQLLKLNITAPLPKLHIHLQAYFMEQQSVWQKIMHRLSVQKSVHNLEVQGQNNIWYCLSAGHINEGGQTVVEGSLTDITERKQQSLKLAFLASHDPLTHLYNRTEFESHLQDAIHSQSTHTLLFIDLDQFKVINDTCGHIAGDECLRQITAIFKQHTSPQDSLARLGGDEFAVVLWDQHQTQGKASAKRLCQALEANHFLWLQRIFKTTISVGLVIIDEKIDSGAQALSLADAACYEAKEAGRNQVVVNDPNKPANLCRASQMDMVTTLTQALKEHHLVLFQQSIIPLGSAVANLHHYEVLVRLHTDTGLMNPGGFMPAAQRYQMLPQIDRWVFAKSCAWLAEGNNLAETGMMNINLSAQTLTDPHFIAFVCGCLADYAIPAEKLCFEINEYCAINNFTKTLHPVYTLRDLGFNFALDDFGTGFASFDHAKRLPIDIIKIDGQFIRNINQDANDKAIVQAITDIAHNLGKTVVAKWIEDTNTLATIRELGIDFGQGYYLGKPEALYNHELNAVKMAHTATA
jgi:diguanylate cyclase (GGDEF)-like protein